MAPSLPRRQPRMPVSPSPSSPAQPPPVPRRSLRRRLLFRLILRLPALAFIASPAPPPPPLSHSSRSWVRPGSAVCQSRLHLGAVPSKPCPRRRALPWSPRNLPAEAEAALARARPPTKHHLLARLLRVVAFLDVLSVGFAESSRVPKGFRLMYRGWHSFHFFSFSLHCEARASNQLGI